MVSQALRRKQAIAVLSGILATQFLFSACGIKRWWGESRPKPAVIQLPGSNDGGCAEFARVVLGSEEESQAVFECWVKKLDGVWDQVEGKDKQALSEKEVATLVRRGVLEIPGDREKLLEKAFAIKKLLGFGNSVTKAKFDSWLALARGNRATARVLFQKLQAADGSIRFEDLQQAASIVSSVLREMRWDMSSEDLGTSLASIFGEGKSAELREGFVPAAKVGINVLNSICPTFSKRDHWNTEEFGNCLVQFFDYFKVGAPWMEFVVNRWDPSTSGSPEQVARINQSMELLMPKVESWFNQPQLTSIYTQRLIDLAESIGVTPPEKLTEWLGILKKFNSRSSGARIHPSLFVHVFEGVKKFDFSLLEGIPYFLSATRDGRCVNSDQVGTENVHLRWKECVPPELDKIRLESDLIDYALRVKNTKHGQEAAPFTGTQFAKIMLFDVLAGEIIRDFDADQDGLISSRLGKEDDEVVQLLKIGVYGSQVVMQFIENITKKWDGLPVGDGIPLKEFRNFDLNGLARLVTMTSDVLVQRTSENKNALRELLANLFNVNPKGSVFLDRMAIAAVLTTADSLSLYREGYLKDIRDKHQVVALDGDTSWLVHRAALTKRLPELLQKHFPRTFKSCSEFGFDRSCGITLNKLIPESDPGSDYIRPGDLDLMTVIAVSMEGLLDGCEKNDDGLLTWNLLDGEDELDCAFARTKDIVQRLIEAKIIKTSDSKKINLALDAVNSIFITRIAGKVAMVKGSMDWMFLNIPFFWAYNDASIGSIYGLVSNIVDKDSTEELQKVIDQAKQKSENPEQWITY